MTSPTATIDQFGRASYGNYTIEYWKDHKTYSIYNKFNSMYDCKDGFKSVRPPSITSKNTKLKILSPGG